MTRAVTTREHRPVLAAHPWRQLAAFYLWLLAVAAVFDFGVFSLRMSPWAGVLLQALGYAIDVLPIVIWAPQILRTIPAPRRQLSLGVLVVVVATIIAAATRMYHDQLAENVIECLVTGLCEELAFRGLIWQLLRNAGLGTIAVIVVNVMLFTGWHVVSVVASRNDWDSLIGVAVYGTIFSLIRLRAGTIALPALVHAAIDIVGL
jgi:membrane protease YdiL (CAAX protease family)